MHGIFKDKWVITITFLITILSSTSSRTDIQYQGHASVVLVETSIGEGEG